MASVKTLYKKAVKDLKGYADDQISALKKSATTQKEQNNKIYADAISSAQIKGKQAQESTENQFQSSYDRNAAAQLVAERQLKEKMANAGLGSSGLNASQQLALAVQRLNADRATTAAKQQAKSQIASQTLSTVNDYKAAQAEGNSAIEKTLADSIANIRSNMANTAYQSATDRYNTQQTNKANKQIASAEAKSAEEVARIEADADKVKANNEKTEAELKLFYDAVATLVKEKGMSYDEAVKAVEDAWLFED